MMAFLLDLPVEMREAIFHYVPFHDLKNLSLTSKALHELTRENLWKNVRFNWESLLNNNWGHPNNRKKLQNLKWTKSLRFLDSDRTLDHPNFFSYKIGADDFRSLLRKRWSSRKVKKIIKNYKLILSYCDADNMIDFQTSRGGVLISHACQVLKKLKVLSITDVINISSTGDKTLPDPLSQINELEHLVELHAYACQLLTNHEVLMLSSTLKQLKVLDLGLNYFADDVVCLKHLSMLTQLQELYLSDCNLTNPSLAHIVGLPLLQSLDISYNNRITDAGVEKLVQTKSLIHLNVSGCGRISDEGARMISSLSLLRTLKMSLTHISDVGMMHLSTLGALEQLHIRKCFKLTCCCLTYIKEMKSLKFLNIRENAQFEEAPLMTLADHRSLKEMNCQGLSIKKIGDIEVIDQRPLHLGAIHMLCHAQNREN